MVISPMLAFFRNLKTILWLPSQSFMQTASQLNSETQPHSQTGETYEASCGTHGMTWAVTCDTPHLLRHTLLQSHNLWSACQAACDSSDHGSVHLHLFLQKSVNSLLSSVTMSRWQFWQHFDDRQSSLILGSSRRFGGLEQRLKDMKSLWY